MYDVHLKLEDAIAEKRLDRKLDEIEAGATLRIGYAGRADPGKGGLDWISLVRTLVDAGHKVCATWLGDGPIFEEMRSAAKELGITECVHLPGFVSDRNEVLEFLKDSHLLLFCHKLQESPRILVESLVCGTPIIGYHSSYAQDLIADNDWGQLTPPNDIQSLANTVASLDQKRDRLAQMAGATASAGAIYNDKAVFRHRSEVIKANL